MTKGGLTKSAQLEKLRSKLSKDEQADACRLAAEAPDVVRYAFRLINDIALTKKEQGTYNELVVNVSQEAADTWRTAKLAAKSAGAA